MGVFPRLGTYWYPVRRTWYAPVPIVNSFSIANRKAELQSAGRYAFVGLSNFPSFDRNYAGKERTKTSFGYFELILCSQHTIDRSAHLFQNKSRRYATHHFELIRLTWTNFKSIGLHSFDGEFNHVSHLHDRSAFHVFKIKVTQEFGLYRRRGQVKHPHFVGFPLHAQQRAGPR